MPYTILFYSFECGIKQDMPQPQPQLPYTAYECRKNFLKNAKKALKTLEMSHKLYIILPSRAKIFTFFNGIFRFCREFQSRLCAFHVNLWKIEQVKCAVISPFSFTKCHFMLCVSIADELGWLSVWRIHIYSSTYNKMVYSIVHLMASVGCV